MITGRKRIRVTHSYCKKNVHVAMPQSNVTFRICQEISSVIEYWMDSDRKIVAKNSS